MTADRTVQFTLGGTLRISVDEPEARPGSIVTLHYDGFSVTARGEDMSYKLPYDHAVKCQVSYVDSAGHAAAVDGDVDWASSNESVATVQVDADDTSIAVVAPAPGGQLGQVQITATADADLGSGVRELITTMDVEIVAGEAIAGTISPVGEPTPITPQPRK